MQHDLAFLPAWYGSGSDFVFLEEDLSPEFILSIQELQANIGRAITKETLGSKDKELSLWGISQQAIKYFERISLRYNSSIAIPQWKEIYRLWCSRQTSTLCLNYLIEQIPEIETTIRPSFFDNMEDIISFVNKQNAYLLAKAPYSSSGRGLVWINSNEIMRSERQQIQGILKKQSCISIEAVLNKHLDFAMEFSIDKEQEVHFIGLSLFQTSPKGAYLGNLICQQKDIENTISQYIDPHLLNKIENSLCLYIKENFACDYQGYLGVDMMIYESNKKYMLHPCIEINMRSNMGVLAIHLHEKILEQHSNASFSIDYSSERGYNLSKHRELTKSFPPIFENNKLKSGYLSLCPVSEKSRYMAYVKV